MGSLDPGSNPGSPITGLEPIWVQAPAIYCSEYLPAKHGHSILGESSNLCRATKTTVARLSFVMACKGSPPFVRCSNCGKCCEKTEMELSSEGIKRLVEAGHRLEEFAVMDDGVTRLRNVEG